MRIDTVSPARQENRERKSVLRGEIDSLTRVGKWPVPFARTVTQNPVPQGTTDTHVPPKGTDAQTLQDRERTSYPCGTNTETKPHSHPNLARETNT